MKDVTTQHSDYSRNLPNWELVRDSVEGEAAIKGKSTLYLPRPNPLDDSDEAAKRYDQYLKRAVYFNATGRTLTGMVGIAFRRYPEIDIPPVLDVLRVDTDGAGGGIINQVHRVLEDVLMNGRAGLLVDFPKRNTAISRAEQVAENIHATINAYHPEEIINWRTGPTGKLELVVLEESVIDFDSDEPFASNTIEQWRELRMVDRVYTVRLWQKKKGGDIEVVEEFTPKDGNGKVWNEIPFTFVGSIDNNSDVDKAPLFDLSCVNIAHFRNSADYEESTFFVGQPTIVFTGLDEQWHKFMKEQGVYVGSRAAVPLPVGASAMMLQASPNTLAGQAMNDKEDQMVALGARLLTPGEAVKTAEQSRSETAAAHSVLSLACDNVSAAYMLGLKWCARFMRAPEDSIVFSIPTDFVGLQLDPNMLNALVAAWQKGGLPDDDYFAAMKQLGLIDPDKTNEQITEELEVSESSGIPALPLNEDDDEDDMMEE